VYQKLGAIVSRMPVSSFKGQAGSKCALLWDNARASANVLGAAPSLEEGALTMRIAIVIVVFCLARVWAGEQGTPTAMPPNPCVAPEQKQLEFWVGEWDLSWPGEKQGEVAHGTNNIRRVLETCVVEENFSGESAMHLRGMSVSTFDTHAKKWKQTWVDNEGGYLDFVGEFKAGQMILGRDAVRPDGTKVKQRMVFKNISRNEFDWSWEASKDGGKTWEVQWPIHYKRRA
jgi:hypothetical protein